MRRRRLLLGFAGGALTLLVLAFVALLWVSNSPWGHERARRMLLESLDDVVRGEISVGRIEGSLLGNVRFINVRVVDDQGRPFLEADTVALRLALLPLLRRRVELYDVHILNATVVVDKPPHEEWNFVRVFPTNPDPTRPPSKRRWGDWVRFHDVELVNTRVTVRTDWEPAGDLTPAQQQEALRRALSPDSRENVVEVPGGYQNVMDFRELNAELANILVAHPDSAATVLDILSLNGVLEPFRPPAAIMKDMAGHFRLVHDSLFMTDVSAVLPESRFSGEGIYALETGEIVLHMDASPAGLADLRWLQPLLPEEGGGPMHIELRKRLLATRAIITDADVRVRESHLSGKVDITVGDTLRLGDTDVRFERLDTKLIEQVLPTVDVPVDGHLTGHMIMAGVPQSLDVDGDIEFEDTAGTKSHVFADGEIGVNGNVHFSDLSLRFAPLQAELASLLTPGPLPFAGTIEGTARLTGDLRDMNLESDLTLRDPRTGVSHVLADGRVQVGDDLRLQNLVLRFDPLQAAVVKDFVPTSPMRGTILGRATVSGVWKGRLQVDSDVTIRDPRGGPSRVRAVGGLDASSDDLRLVALRVTMDPLHLNVLRDDVPNIPADATVEGEVLLNGLAVGRINVDGSVVLHDPVSGDSRIAGRGGVELADGLRFHTLLLDLQPLQMALIPRIGGPETPLGGTLRGTTALDGDIKGRLAFDADVEHEEAGERSHVIGQGTVNAGPRGEVVLDLQLDPVSMVTLGRFAPAAGLQGSARGTLRASGVKSALNVQTDMELPGGGTVTGGGTLDLSSEDLGYDVALMVQSLDLGEVSRRVTASTALTGNVVAQGRGVDPATMEARVEADLQGFRANETYLDEVRLRASVADGVARSDSSVVRLETAEATLDGTFGLVAGKEGVLRYELRVDSLRALAPWVPGADTAVVQPRPAVRRVVAEAAQAERNRVLRSAEVERMATGRPVPDSLLQARLPDERVGIPVDSLAGRVHAAGELSGSIQAFDARGSAELERVVFRGNYVGSGDVQYQATNVRTSIADVNVDASLKDVLARGFAYDSTEVHLEYQGGREGSGSLNVQAFQDEYTDIDAGVRFTLAEGIQQLRLDDVQIRLDSTTWRSTGAGVIRWGSEGVFVESLVLGSDANERLLIHGGLPAEGSSELRMVAENVDLAHVKSVLQADFDVTGRVGFDVQASGTRSDPRIVAQASLADGSIGGTSVQNVRGNFEYADQQLTGQVEVLDQQRVLAVADLRLPIDLALEGVTGSRLLDAPISVDVKADSLPVGALSALTNQVDQVTGVARGEMSVRGTFDDPVVDGDLTLDDGSFHAVSLGVTFSEIGGRLALEGNRLTVDSLTAVSGGTINVTGGIDLTTLREPTFDMHVEARDARVLDNDEGKLTVDADLDVKGPFDDVAVTGQVTTRRGVIYIPELQDLGETSVVALDEPATFERVDTLLAARRDLLLERHPLLSAIHVDIGVTVNRDVWLRSLETNVEIYTPPELGPMRVQLDGEQRALILEGIINTDRGEYEFMTRPFQLTRGSVTFLGDRELDAVLQVAAEHEVRIPGRQAFAIRVLLGGTLRAPTITMESTAQPPISQTELLTYVALGPHAGAVLPVQGSALSSQGDPNGDFVGNAAALATQQIASAAVGTVLNDIEGEAARSLGVDVLRITPADLPNELFQGKVGDVLLGTEIEIGSYVTPRLFASAQTLATFVRPGARLEYLSPNGFRWITTWQPRYLPSEPTLAEQDPLSKSVFGLLLRREWRF